MVELFLVVILKLSSPYRILDCSRIRPPQGFSGVPAVSELPRDGNRGSGVDLSHGGGSVPAYRLSDGGHQGGVHSTECDRVVNERRSAASRPRGAANAVRRHTRYRQARRVAHRWEASDQRPRRRSVRNDATSHAPHPWGSLPDRTTGKVLCVYTRRRHRPAPGR